MKRTAVVLGVLAGLLGSIVFAGTLENNLSEARKLFDQGSYKEAEKAYRDILTKQKDELKGRSDLTPRVWQGLGESLMRQGKTKDAQKILERVGAHKGGKTEFVEEKVADPLGQVPAAVGGEELASSNNPEVKELYRNATAFLRDGGSKIVVINTLLEACKKRSQQFRFGCKDRWSDSGNHGNFFQRRPKSDGSFEDLQERQFIRRRKGPVCPGSFPGGPLQI